jgi:hypothetical protein
MGGLMAVTVAQMERSLRTIQLPCLQVRLLQALALNALKLQALLPASRKSYLLLLPALPRPRPPRRPLGLSVGKCGKKVIARLSQSLSWPTSSRR